jgi:hypothetical protein
VVEIGGWMFGNLRGRRTLGHAETGAVKERGQEQSERIKGRRYPPVEPTRRAGRFPWADLGQNGSAHTIRCMSKGRRYGRVNRGSKRIERELKRNEILQAVIVFASFILHLDTSERACQGVDQDGMKITVLGRSKRFRSWSAQRNTKH